MMTNDFDENQFIFDKSLLNSTYRKQGISAFMRIKNGAEFLQETIESHIPFFDEIIACYNDCSDNTEAILLDFKKKNPEKLKVYYYKPKVHPSGSELHKTTSVNSINSLVNFYNYTLSKTTFTVATKLDDDHIAIGKNLKRAIDFIKNKWDKRSLLVFSGLNLIKNHNQVAIYKNNMFSGNSDICFFPVNKNNYYVHDSRFEKFKSNLKRKKYVGLLFYHLKFLKDNYDLINNPKSRYAKMYNDFIKSKTSISFDEFEALIKSPKNIIKKYNKYRFKSIFSQIFKQVDTYKYDRAKSLEKDYLASKLEIELIEKF